jgi:hypothetical protein
MGISADIWRSWRHGPGPVIREHVARGPGEARAFAFLMIGLFLVVLAQFPALSRDAAAAATGQALVTTLARSLPPEARTMDAMAAYTIMPWLLLMPIVFYALALLAHGLSNLLGGHGTAFGARVALFWSWLAAAPVALLAGLMSAFADRTATNVTGILWIAVFAAFWWLSQREAARGPVVHGA